MRNLPRHFGHVNTNSSRNPPRGRQNRVKHRQHEYKHVLKVVRHKMPLWNALKLPVSLRHASSDERSGFSACPLAVSRLMRPAQS